MVEIKERSLGSRVVVVHREIRDMLSLPFPRSCRPYVPLPLGFWCSYIWERQTCMARKKKLFQVSLQKDNLAAISFSFHYYSLRTTDKNVCIALVTLVVILNSSAFLLNERTVQ